MSLDYIEKFDYGKTESTSPSSLTNEVYESRRSSLTNNLKDSQSTSSVNEMFGSLEIFDPGSERASPIEQGDGKPDSAAVNGVTASSFEDILFTLLTKYAKQHEKGK